jgi:hypothetical protein
MTGNRSHLEPSNRSKLVAFLQSELGELLPIADLKAIVHQVKEAVHQWVQRRFL